MLRVGDGEGNGMATPSADRPASAHPVVFTERQKRTAVVGVLIAMFLAALDQTIVAPALPTIGGALGDAQFLPWVISAYLLTSTATTPLYGKASDIVGRRPALYLALLIFLVGSLGCALATSMVGLVLARALQGLGGGGLIVMAQTVIADMVSPRERARYVVYISTVWATSSIAGPMIGGALSQHVGWPMIFWINLPLGALAFAICRVAIRDLNSPRRDHRLDWAGAVLLTLSSVALLLLLTIARDVGGWTSPASLALLSTGVVSGVVLAWHLRRVREPLVPLSLFGNDVIGMASLALFFSMFAYVGSTVYVPIFLVSYMGADPTTAGGALIVLLGGAVIGANTAGRRMSRAAHYKRLATYGLIVATCALLVIAAFIDRLDFWSLEALLLIVGVGIGPLFPTATVSVQNAADPRDLGVATAALAFLRSFGGAIGVAVLGAVALAFGVVATDGAVAVGSAEHATIAAAFRWVFAAEALATAVSLLAFLQMREMPLRGPVAREAPASGASAH